jgi:hypothetical protein
MSKDFERILVTFETEEVLCHDRDLGVGCYFRSTHIPPILCGLTVRAAGRNMVSYYALRNRLSDSVKCQCGLLSQENVQYRVRTGGSGGVARNN